MGAKKDWADGFNKGRESVLRKNTSGCCCLFDEDDNIVSLCDVHRKREDVLREELTKQKHRAQAAIWQAARFKAELSRWEPMIDAVKGAKLYSPRVRYGYKDFEATSEENIVRAALRCRGEE